LGGEGGGRRRYRLGFPARIMTRMPTAHEKVLTMASEMRNMELSNLILRTYATMKATARMNTREVTRVSIFT